MSIAPVMISENVARPSCVRVVRGAPRPSTCRCGWCLPLSEVSVWMKASCWASCSRSRSENIAVARRVMRLLQAVALDGSAGSSTTSTLSSQNIGADAFAQHVGEFLGRNVERHRRQQSVTDHFVGDGEHFARAVDVGHVLAAVPRVGTAVQQRRAARELGRADAAPHLRGDAVTPRGLVQPVADRMAAVDPLHQRVERGDFVGQHLRLRRRCRKLRLAAPPAFQERSSSSSGQSIAFSTLIRRPIDASARSHSSKVASAGSETGASSAVTAMMLSSNVLRSTLMCAPSDTGCTHSAGGAGNLCGKSRR